MAFCYSVDLEYNILLSGCRDYFKCLKNDEPCNLFLETCKQCYSSPDTLSILSRILKIKLDIENEQNLTSQEFSSISISEILVGILVITSIIALFSVVFGSFTIYCRNKQKITKRKEFRVFIGQEEKKLELKISKCEKVYQVKTKICHKLKIEPNKKVKVIMKYWTTVLDNNSYLLSYVEKGKNDPFCVYIVKYPEEISIEYDKRDGELRSLSIMNNKNISDLKIIMTENLGEQNISVFKSILDKYEKLEDSREIGSCPIMANEKITVVKRTTQEFKLSSIFGNSFFMKTCETDDTVEQLLVIVEETFSKLDKKNFLFFYHGKYMEPRSYLFEYNIERSEKIKFLYWNSPTDVICSNKCLDKGYISELYEARRYSSQIETKFLLRKYSYKNCKKATGFEMVNFLKDLATYEFAYDNPLFVKLYGVYKNDDAVYLKIEYITETLTTFLNKKKSITDEKVISKWTNQVVQCIKLMDEHGFHYSNLTPYVLLVKDGDLKMFTFNQTKYLSESNFRLVSMDRSLSDIYLAPETRSKKSGYDYHVNSYKPSFWSWGIILYQMVTGKCPMKSDEKSGFVISSDLNISEELNNFIHIFLKEDPENRPTIEGILEHSFMKKNLNK